MSVLRHTFQVSLLCGLMIGVMTAGASTIFVVAAADATLKASDPTGNYGTGDLLIGTGGGGVDDISRAIIYFDMTGQPQAVNTYGEQKLDIVAVTKNSVMGFRMDVYKINAAGSPNAGWGELVATWNNFDQPVPTAWVGGPGLGAPGGAGYPAGNVDDHTFANETVPWYMQLDVPASLINGWINDPSSNAGFLVRMATEDGTQVHNLTLASRENSQYGPPVLRYVPEPGSLSLLLLGGLASLWRRH